MAVKKTYFAVYNQVTKEVLFEKGIPSDAVMSDRYKDYHDPDAPLVPYTAHEYALEVMGRGNPWKVYQGDAHFTWDALAAKESTVQEETT